MFSKLVYFTTASLVHGQDEFDFGAEVTAFEDGDFNFDDFNPDDFENFKAMTQNYTEEELAAIEELKETDPELYAMLQADMEAAAWDGT